MTRRQQRRRADRRSRDSNSASVRRRMSVGAGLSLGAAFALPASAQAVDYTVTTNANSGGGSLRDAITTANGTTAVDDRILFASNVTGAITLTTGGQISITDALDIQGPGAAALTVSGNNASRIFNVDPGTAGEVVRINRLTLSGGYATDGGAVRDQDAYLYVTESVLTDNNAIDRGGALFEAGGFSMGSAANLENSTISNNHARNQGGGVYAFFGFGDISASTITGNSTLLTTGPALNPGAGGGLYIYGNAGIYNATIAGNAAAGKGGGIFRGTAAVPFPYVINSIVADNTVGSTGKDVSGTIRTAADLIENTSGATLNQAPGTIAITGVDPLLGPLQNNGGPTPTLRPAFNSPVVDQAANGFLEDQRFSAVPVDIPFIANSTTLGANGSDLGSVELTLAEATPPSPPSSDIEFGKVKRNTKKGTATLTVTVKAPGEISLGGSGIAAIALARASRQVAAGSVELKVKPAKGKSGKKVRKSLDEKGKATVKAQVTFKPTGGTANTETTKVKLVKN